MLFSIKSKSGDKLAINNLNYWLSDWCKNNPSYMGVNWKCAQEASIRIIHLAISAKVLDQKIMLDDLKNLIIAHLKRISSSTTYALSQENNHITSEAAALYIGGLWCLENNIQKGQQWKSQGRSLLEKSVFKLVDKDGGFSQYSVNYHRLFLDTISSVEIIRLWFEDESFTNTYYNKIRKSTLWLYALVNSENGDAPNIGANDGSNLLAASSHDYRDYRPSVQLAMVLFRSRIAYPIGVGINFFLRLNDILLPTKKIQKAKSQNFTDSGLFVLKNKSVSVYLKYPKYKFRPKHCDALHMDFWIGTKNIFRDCGTYKYNSSFENNFNFSGVKYHNTIQFDNREQMPSLGRFLRGEWLNSQDVLFEKKSKSEVFARASYRDWKGSYHKREVQLIDRKLVIKDTIKGFKKNATLRWNLLKANWKLKDSTLESQYCAIKIDSSMPIVTTTLNSGWDSRYYSKKEEINVLHSSFKSFGEIITTITF